MFIHQQIEYKGKIYGYYRDARGIVVPTKIRSETNPEKTPYLKPGSKMFNQVMAEILK